MLKFTDCEYHTFTVSFPCLAGVKPVFITTSTNLFYDNLIACHFEPER